MVVRYFTGIFLVEEGDIFQIENSRGRLSLKGIFFTEVGKDLEVWCLVHRS